jgi:hypothetical protein
MAVLLIRNEARCLVHHHETSAAFLAQAAAAPLEPQYRASGSSTGRFAAIRPPVVADVRSHRQRIGAFDHQLSFSPISLNDYCKAATVIRSVATAQQDAQSLNGFKVLSRSGSQISALRVEAS